MRKLTIEEVKERCLKNNIELLSKVYMGSLQHLEVKCMICDYCDFKKWLPNVDNISHGHGCPNCYLFRRRKTDTEKYGITGAEQIKAKRKQTNLERFGVENPSILPEIQAKQRQTNLLHHGVAYPAQSKQVREKLKQTNLSHWGVEYPSQNIEIQEKTKQTFLKKYGVDHPSKNKEISLKIARSTNQITVLKHWFSREDIECRGTYEVAVIEYFNKNQIDYNFQPQTFLMPNGYTYTPDIYLPNQNLWVEIKGTFRTWDPTDDAEKKWNWFHGEYPNSELWSQNKLKELGLWKRILELQKERKKKQEETAISG